MALVTKRLMVLQKLLRSEEHTSELQSRPHLVCRLLLEKKKCAECAVPARSAPGCIVVRAHFPCCCSAATAHRFTRRAPLYRGRLALRRNSAGCPALTPG